MTRDPRIDAYIAEAAPFAQPILTHLRTLVHTAIPDLEEAVKWSMPHFVYRGKNLAGFAAFKAHASFMIHGDGRQDEGMGQFGKLTALADLPDDAVLIERLVAARKRIDDGGTALKKRPVPKPPKADIPTPDDFAAALNQTAGALDTFNAFPPGARREYIEWVVEAKRAETREKRIARAVEWIAAGKRRNWKYEKC